MPEQVDNIINKMTGGDVSTASNQNAGNVAGRRFYCDAKSQEQLNDFVNGARPKLIALVGFAGYGKSTFVGSLYHLLTRNLSYGGYKLVDSDTYVGFERRVFLRRVNDDNTSDTKRTVLGENDILHLKLRSEKGYYHSVLVSDKSGETYAKYTSSDEDIEADVVMANTDLAVFFVDAEEDSGKLAAHNLMTEKYESLLTRLKAQHKLIGTKPYVVVFTKIDKVGTAEQKKKLAERKEKMCGVFSSNIGRAPEAVYEIDSTNLEDEQLNELFGKLIQAKEKGEEQKNLDWVKAEIEKEK
ncbi:MAG: hypothetical protein PUH91_00450 [Prevotella sp.]|nr:hypothetical protein [Prevotella sp.]